MDILNLIRRRSKSSEIMDDSKKSKSKSDAESDITTEKKTPEEEIADHGFKIGRVIGQGSYSTVRLATYKDKDIAVKVINGGKVSADFRYKFLPREIEVLSKINHQNIIHVFKIFTFPKKVYIFTEYLPKGDLLSYVKRKRNLSERKARLFFKQMVSALQYLHGLNIAHRDLKCENIMLTYDDNIRLIDFGFCRSTVKPSGGRVLSHTYCGSTAYAAPEVLQGIPYNPMLYDVWSLGCILFIMICGCMPFDDSNVKKQVDHQLKKKIKFPRGVSLNSDVKGLIKIMLEPEVTERISMNRVSANKWVTKDDEPSSKSSENEI